MKLRTLFFLITVFLSAKAYPLEPTMISQAEGAKLTAAKSCDLRISYGSYASGIPYDVVQKVAKILATAESIESYQRWNWGHEGEYDLCLNFKKAQELKVIHDKIATEIPEFSKRGYTTLFLKGEVTKKTTWPPEGK